MNPPEQTNWTLVVTSGFAALGVVGLFALALKHAGSIQKKRA
jgi:hypothetical protein